MSRSSAWLLAAVVALHGASADASTVVLTRVTGARPATRWRAAEDHLRDELRALGLTVAEARVPTAQPAAIAALLAKHTADAAVQVTRAGKRASVVVWLAAPLGSAPTRVEVAVDARERPSVAMLRAAELVRAQIEDHLASATAPPLSPPSSPSTDPPAGGSTASNSPPPLVPVAPTPPAAAQAPQRSTTPLAPASPLSAPAAPSSPAPAAQSSTSPLSAPPAHSPSSPPTAAQSSSSPLSAAPAHSPIPPPTAPATQSSTAPLSAHSPSSPPASAPALDGSPAIADPPRAASAAPTSGPSDAHDDRGPLTLGDSPPTRRHGLYVAAAVGGGSIGALTGLELEGRRELTRRLEFGGGVSSYVTPGWRADARGSILVGLAVARLALASQFSLAPRISLRLAGGGGLALAWAAGRAVAPYRGSVDTRAVGTVFVALALVVRVTPRAALHAGAAVDVLAPSLLVRSADSEFASLGPVLARGFLGLSWGWPLLPRR